MPWACTHAIRSKALLTRESCSHSHESPSYKVHDHPHTHRHVYIHTSCIMLSHRARKINRNCQRSKGMAKQGTGNVKQTFPYPGNATQARSRNNKGTRRGGTLIHALEKRLREREKEKTTQEGLGPIIYWTFPFVGLHLLACTLTPFCLHLGGCTLTPSIYASCVYMQ